MTIGHRCDPWTFVLRGFLTNDFLQADDTMQGLLHVISLVDKPKHVKFFFFDSGGTSFKDKLLMT